MSIQYTVTVGELDDRVSHDLDLDGLERDTVLKVEADGRTYVANYPFAPLLGTLDGWRMNDVNVICMIRAAKEARILVAENNADGDQPCWLLHFGAYGDTHVLAWGDLCDALENAANVLSKGCFTDIADAYNEAIDQYDAVWHLLAVFSGETADDLADDHRRVEWSQEQAEVDMTYTESGYLASHEWGYSIENPTLEDILALPVK